MVLKIERLQPEGMNVRMSRGKPSYSHVVTVSSSGKIVYTAGQLARDIDGQLRRQRRHAAQMEQTFQNLDRCLKAAGDRGCRAAALPKKRVRADAGLPGPTWSRPTPLSPTSTCAISGWRPRGQGWMISIGTAARSHARRPLPPSYCSKQNIRRF